MLEKENPNNLFPTILELLVEGKVYAKCPKCGKSLGIMEVYNNHCAFCGKIPFDDMIILKGLVEHFSQEEITTAEDVPIIAAKPNHRSRPKRKRQLKEK